MARGYKSAARPVTGQELHLSEDLALPTAVVTQVIAILGVMVGWLPGRLPGP